MIRLPHPIVRRLRARAEAIMARAPDMRIGGAERPYLERWYGVPRNRWGNAYVHLFLRDDDDRALHDHPWPSLSIMLAGLLRETWVPRGEDATDTARHRTRIVAPGDVVFRGARFAHRLDVVQRPAVTLFLTGPRLREWGFWCPQGFRPWHDFVHPDDPGAVGPGCE